MDEDARVRYDSDDMSNGGDKEYRDSSRHRSKERNRERRNKDRGRSKEIEDSSRKDLDRHDTRERDRDRHWGKDKERSRDKVRDRERERSSDRARDKGRERESTRDYERGKEREKVRDKGHEKSRRHEKDEVEREKAKDKDHERGRDRGRDDKGKEREREKGKLNDREKEERESERDRNSVEKGRSKEKSRESGRHRESEYDRSRMKDKEWEEDGRGDGGTKGVEGDGEKHERNDLSDRDEKLVGSRPTSELEDRLTKIRQEKLKRKADDASEILSWVSKSRKIEEKRNVEKEKAARTSKILDEQDNIEEDSDDEAAAGQSRKDLAGVKILHGLDKVIEGGAVVLTLKDQSILADGDINEEVDMLENVEIGEQRRRDEAYKAAKKTTGYEDKFNDDLSAPRTILPQYDDPIEDEGVTLDGSGRFTGEAEKKLEELRKRIEGGSTIRPFENLTSTGQLTSDYYTTDEMLQFKKPKKKKSLRKREKLDMDALEAEAISAGLGAGDLGSRKDSKRLSAKEEEAKHDAKVRSNAYQSALAKAEEASKVLHQEQILTAKSSGDDDLVFGEDYQDLEKSLEQARKLALKRKEEAGVSGPQAVALLAAANKHKEDNQSSMKGELEENKVVITEMEEFVLGLQLKEETHQPEPEDVFNDEEDIPKPVQCDMEVEIGGWKEFIETNTDEEMVSEEKDITPDEIIHEVAVGKGLSGALKLLKDRGTLKETIDWGGRNMDKKKSKLLGINDNDGPKEIRIERTDEFGRIMTPKEAFRKISHKFHGKEPGKMKQEKRLKQFQEDLKTKQMKASDTPLLAMERMREAQVLLQSPYIVLSGHVKPGQTSDPRSGFATVEKDHPGSLTPMLGDKKVEHFLGISRKSDMGPPPPRKRKN